jgi:DNA-binding transcriptional LysR family regulator
MRPAQCSLTSTCTGHCPPDGTRRAGPHLRRLYERSRTAPLSAASYSRVSGGFSASVHALAEDFPYDLSERLRNDQIDVAFIRTPVANPQGIVIDPLQEEAVVAALPSRHALARTNTALTLKSLAGETFVIYGRPQGTLTLQGNAIVAGCQAAGFTPHVGYVAPHHLSTLNLVAAGLGVSLVSASVQRMNIAGVVFRPVKGAAQIKVPLNIALRRGDASAVVRQFLKLAKHMARSFGAQEGKSR